MYIVREERQKAAYVEREETGELRRRGKGRTAGRELETHTTKVREEAKAEELAGKEKLKKTYVRRWRGRRLRIGEERCTSCLGRSPLVRLVLSVN